MFTHGVPSEGALMEKTRLVPDQRREAGTLGAGAQSRKPAWEALELRLKGGRCSASNPRRGRCVGRRNGLHEVSWGRGEQSRLWEQCAISRVGKMRVSTRNCSLSVSVENSTKHCHM